MKKVTVYIGIGSNVGDRAACISAALKELTVRGDVRLLRLSPFYLTSPVGPRQRAFLNAAAKLHTSLQPKKLLLRLKDIEHALGRKPAVHRWGPRRIDLDILFYGRKIIKSNGLVIPHPEIARRRFVLEPLAVISPGYVHPCLRQTIRKMRDAALLTCPEQKVTIYSPKHSEK